MQQIQTKPHGERLQAVSARVQAHSRRFADAHIEELASSLYEPGATFEQALGKATSLIHALELSGSKLSFDLYQLVSERLNTLVHAFIDQAAQSAESFVTLAEKLAYMDELHEFAHIAMEHIAAWEMAIVPHLQTQTV